MEEMIFNLADTHLFFNDLEVRISKMHFAGKAWEAMCNEAVWLSG